MDKVGPTDVDIKARVADLMTYVRYLDLYWRVQNDPLNITAIGSLYKHLHRARNRHIVPRIETITGNIAGHNDFVSQYDLYSPSSWDDRTDSDLDDYFGLTSLTTYYLSEDMTPLKWRDELPVFSDQDKVNYPLPQVRYTPPVSLASIDEPLVYDASDTTDWIVQTDNAAAGFGLKICSVITAEQYQSRDEGDMTLTLSDADNGQEVCKVVMKANMETWSIKFNNIGIGFSASAAANGFSNTDCVTPSPLTPVPWESPDLSCSGIVSNHSYKLRVRRGQRKTGMSYRLQWEHDPVSPFNAVTEVSAQANPEFVTETTWTGYFYVPAQGNITHVLGYYANPYSAGTLEAYDKTHNAWVEVPFQVYDKKSGAWMDKPSFWDGLVSTHFQAPISFTDNDGAQRDFFDTVWRFNSVQGQVTLLNVSPYIAMRPEDLLIP